MSNETSTERKGRYFDLAELQRQIGLMNAMAVTGLRKVARVEEADGTVYVFNCGSGYRVEVKLDPDDTYTLRRVFVRGNRRFVKGQVSGVYADEVSDAFYRAGMFRDSWAQGGIE